MHLSAQHTVRHMALLVRGLTLGRTQLRLPMLAPGSNQSCFCVAASVRSVGLLFSETGWGPGGLNR